jgi:hypothetical protein
MPERAPEALVRLTDDGVLHQDDDTPEKIARNPILQKVILPQVRGFVRLEGSNYSAKDFIIVDSEKQGTATVNYRKKLQDALLAKVKPRCAELGIEVRAINLAQMELPQDLREQIALRDTARQELEKNKALIGKFKQEQQYAATKAKEKRSELEVSAKTRLIEATQLAEQKKAVLQAQLKQELESAQIKLDAARNTAKAILAAAQSEADVINAKNKAEVAGLRTSVQGLGGAAAFAQYHVVQRLAPALQEIFAGDDSDFAKLVAGYLMPAPPKSAGATAGNGTGPAPTVPTASGNGK